MSNSEQRTPREVIERIRTHSFLLDLDTESEKVREGAANLQEQLNNALHLLSQDLYSKKSHFILELIQNADDNEYKKGVTPHLLFQVTPNLLVVVNNEIGFSEDNIKAICSVGKSSKPKSKAAGYIGEKGIGFKSVFTVSDAPEIHSNGFHFRFDRTDERNLLGYVVPHWCPAPARVQPGCTTIILPSSKTYPQFSSDTLADLDARLLLFLNKLRQLTLEQDGRRITYRREDEAGVSRLTTESHAENGELAPTEMRYVRVSRSFSMGDFADEKRPGIEQSTVVLAFPVDAAGAAKPERGSYVFAFLPVRQMGFTFAIQADFILNSSREEVLTDRPWNRLLRGAIAAVFCNAIKEFKKTEALGFSYLNYIPAEGEVADPFFRVVRKSILDSLTLLACLPSASGAWKQPSELRIAEKSFRVLFPPKTAVELFGFDYVDQRVQGGSDLLRSLGAKDVSVQDVLSVFRAHGDWLRAQPTEWRADFYAYLASLQEQLLKAGLLTCACLPTSTGTLVVPAQVNVFFPLSRAKRYGFEAELVLVDNELYEEALKRSKRVADLFQALMVRPDEPYALVNSHILPRHRGEAWKSSGFTALIGHLRYVKDKLKDYLESASRHGKTEVEAFQLIRDGIWIGTKHHTGETWNFARVGSLYLSKEYKAHFCIESFMGEAIEPACLVSPDYLASKPKDAEAEAESWRQFFARLGVRLSPAVEPEGTNWKCSKELQLLLDSTHSAVRKATLECLSLHWHSYSNRLRCITVSGRSYIEQDTKFALSLRTTLAPTKKRTPVPLVESYYPSTELKALLGDGLPYIDAVLTEPILDACRVTYKLDAKALVKRLKQLKADAAGTAKQLHGIYRAFDERLWDAEAAFIKQAFHAEGLIQTKGAHKGWSKPGEVSWRSNGSFLDSLYPPLQAQYRDFNRFFLDRLCIPRELPTAKWVEALTRLDSVETIADRKTEALAIYKRANRDLTPKFGRDDVQLPAWLTAFQTDAVYINQRGEMVSNDEYLFANDVPELAALFEDDEALAFLGVPPSEVPRLSRLLEAAGVSRLSESIQLEVIDSDSGVVDSALTARVRRSVQVFARVVYSKRPESFEQALQAGRFARLREFEVAEVSEVRLSVSLGDYSRETTADIALSEERVLYRTGAKSVKDRLAAELCRFLYASVDLADTFTRILMEGDPDGVEDFLRVRSIGVLPPDLLAALDTSAGAHGDEPENDGADGAPTADAESGQELIQDEEHSAADKEATQTGANQGATPRAAGVSSPLAPAPASTTVSRLGSAPVDTNTGNPSPKTGAAAHVSTTPGQAPRPAQSPASGAPAAPAVQPVSGGPSSVGAPVPGANTPPREASNSPPLAEDSSVTQPQSPSGASACDTPGLASNFARGTGPSRSSRARRGKSSPPRTKSGRLMSYASGPGDLAGENPDADPERAAALQAIGRAAVEYFLTTQASRWKSLTEMPHNNPGFDVHAIAADGKDEYIEVKGQSGSWTLEGVALTPTELMTAQQKGDRYWLCVVEFAQDDKRRQLHLLRNPYGLTQQFRFDVGWKSVAESATTVPLRPEKDMYIDMPGTGSGRIISVRDKGRFFNLHVILRDGRQVNKPFNPAKMKLSKEPLWLE